MKKRFHWERERDSGLKGMYAAPGQMVRKSCLASNCQQGRTPGVGEGRGSLIDGGRVKAASRLLVGVSIGRNHRTLTILGWKNKE